MHLDANVKNRLKEDSKTIFSKEPGKEMFPADPTVAAVAFNVVIANCLSKHRKQMEWTSKSFESSKHPSPWAVLIEKANDVHGPRYAFPNYSGMRDMICALDLVLMSFIGGYISAAMDTQLGSKFRKIRVAMLRMTYSDDEKKQFFANANMHSFVEKLEDFKSGLTAIQETTLEQAENATYGSSEKQKTHQSLNQPPASNAIRDLSESEEILIAEMIHYSPIKGHWENALATLQSLADAMFVKLSERGFYGGPAIGADEPATRIRTMPNYFKSEHETLNHEIIVEANYDVFQAGLRNTKDSINIDLYHSLASIFNSPLIKNRSVNRNLNFAAIQAIISDKTVEEFDKLTLQYAFARQNIIVKNEANNTTRLHLYFPVNNPRNTYNATAAFFNESCIENGTPHLGNLKTAGLPYSVTMYFVDAILLWRKSRRIDNAGAVGAPGAAGHIIEDPAVGRARVTALINALDDDRFMNLMEAIVNADNAFVTELPQASYYIVLYFCFLVATICNGADHAASYTELHAVFVDDARRDEVITKVREIQDRIISILTGKERYNLTTIVTARLDLINTLNGYWRAVGAPPANRVALAARRPAPLPADLLAP
jgi:hypothetical protein